MCYLKQKDNGTYIQICNNKYGIVNCSYMLLDTQFGKDATNGMLFIDGMFECYTLEDQYQAVKVMHETCIPEGTYE